MKRKLTALILAAVMLASMCSAATAEEAAAAPTVDEILTEYHQKAMEQQMQATSAAYARSGRSSEKTLEQETVDTLTAAGYEAYNVTADNFDALEAELKTDFADMGLDSDGSYILVIEASADVDGNSRGGNPNARTSPEMDFEQGPVSSGLPTTYTYDGVTYSLRHITVTPTADSDDLRARSVYTLKDEGYIPESWEELLEFSVVTIFDTIGGLPLASFASLLSDMATDSNYTPLGPEHVVVFGGTTWTRKYIHVYDEWFDFWPPRQCSEYAASNCYFTCMVFNEETLEEELFTGTAHRTTTYSPFYYDLDARMFDAAACQRYSRYEHDKVDVDFYINDENSSSGANARYLFSHNSPAF